MAESEKSTQKDGRGRRNDRNINILNNRAIRRSTQTVNDLIDQASMNMYGTDRQSGVEDLNSRFNKILANDLNQLTNNDSGDVSSFLSQIVSNDRKKSVSDEFLNNQFTALTGDEYGTMQSFIYDAYRNQLLEQSDLHEVANQLIELSEAILVTRDAIISPDVVEGRLSRTLSFENLVDDELDSAVSTVEAVEKKFRLLEKIKDFIVPKTLEYGTYYAYIIPYSKLFNDFVKYRDIGYRYGQHAYGESVSVMESFDDTPQSSTASVRGRGPKKAVMSDDSFEAFIESAYEEYAKSPVSSGGFSDPYSESSSPDRIVSKEEFTEDVKNMLGNISVCNDPVPLPILEEGIDTIEAFRSQFVNESGDQIKDGFIENGSAMYFVMEDEDGKVMSEDGAHEPPVAPELFKNVTNGSFKDDGGVSFVSSKNKNTKKKENFDDIRDCYIRMIEPTRIIPIEIMDTVIGYYFVTDEDITPMDGGVSSNLYYARFDEHRRESTVIDAIASQVVKSFDKKFLNKNAKFKKIIVDCINYNNINEKRLKFQFIPVEYMQVFRIDRDVNGHGQSMLKKSLFYAKLYLMLLLFKIMTIVLYSNDTKVNYLRQSGIDKNIFNKVQEIARVRQNRQINMTDLFSYSTLINKVGNGSELYIPLGRSGERPIETEILQGQDVQLNTELMEMLKNSYILGTGVPAAILNYLNEADFAKQIEQNNTKYNGRVVNYQLDFNPDITSMYKKILRSSTNLDEPTIDAFKFTLQPPKSSSTQTKSEMLDQTQRVMDFLTQLLFDDPQQSMDNHLQEVIKKFKIKVAKNYIESMNFDEIMRWVEEAELDAKRESLKPKSSNGDSGEDSYDELLGDDTSGMGAM